MKVIQQQKIHFEYMYTINILFLFCLTNKVVYKIPLANILTNGRCSQKYGLCKQKPNEKLHPKSDLNAPLRVTVEPRLLRVKL